MNRRILMTVVAVVLAVVGTGAVYSYVAAADTRAVDAMKPTDVLIVAKSIPAGTAAQDVEAGSYVRADRLPADATPTGSVNEIGADWGTDVATADIQPGQVVVRDMFGSKVATTSGLAIPESMVAVSVRLSTEGDVAGYVQPGSQIAIFDTFVLLDGKGTPSGNKNSSDKNDNWATKLLLPRVEVLAVSEAAPDGNKAGLDKQDTGNTANLLVTVAVSQPDAERLIHVSQTGMPYAALLSDHSVSRHAPGVDNQNRLGSIFSEGNTAP